MNESIYLFKTAIYEPSRTIDKKLKKMQVSTRNNFQNTLDIFFQKKRYDVYQLRDASCTF